MAISKNLWLNGTIQKLGGAVAYNLKGQQILRKEAAKVANPRTTAQMDQRVKLANLVNFYRANKAWMAKGAFESKKQTWSDYNAFVSANIDGNKVALTKPMANAGMCVVAPYQVTKGTLPALNVSSNGNQAGIGYTATTAPTKWGEFSAALIASYPGLQEGDQFSLIRYLQRKDAEGWPYVSIIAFEKNLDSSDETLLSTLMPDVTFGTGGVSFTASTFGDDTCAISACMSRSVSGSIKVGDSKVTFFDNQTYEEFTTDAMLADAVASYGGSSVNFLDNGTSGLSSSAANGSSGGSGAGDPGDVTP